jgi:uncharacterized protein YbbC (DUF1343 family)
MGFISDVFVMKRLVVLGILIFSLLSVVSCQQRREHSLRLGAERNEVWKPLLEGKKVGVLVNHTSMVGDRHLVDIMVTNGIDVRKIFAPEHGFRGNYGAGEIVNDETDPATGIPVISLYHENRKPKDENIRGLDVVVFDIQDVGVRFYTYISTMHYMMEACARNNVAFIVLDRPNPNGDYVDGPVLKPEFRSFVGMHPIPVVHGLTVGELAKMINGERWLDNSLVCDLQVIKMDDYNHSMKYVLPVKPSPNLPNYLSVRLYPSLCLFEATVMSVGRGTNFPFQVVGAPDSVYGSFSFVPRSIEGMDSSPKYHDKTCYGEDFRSVSADEYQFSLAPLIRFYKKSGREQGFFSRPEWFYLLIGNDIVLEQIKNGVTEAEIKEAWTEELVEYEVLRQKYLLYP